MKTSRNCESVFESRSSKKSYKIADSYVEYGCGFPVHLTHVPMVEDDGVWIPDIDYNRLDKIVLLEICKMPYRLTGNQVRYIRLYFEKTLEEFAGILKVKHSSIVHWENQKDKIAKITWGTELAIRLFVLYKLGESAKKFQQDYAELMVLQIKGSPTHKMKIEASHLQSCSH